MTRTRTVTLAAASCFLVAAFDIPYLTRAIVEEAVDVSVNTGILSVMSQVFMLIYSIYISLAMMLIIAGGLLWRCHRLGGWAIGAVLIFEMSLLTAAVSAFLTNTAMMNVISIELYENVIESLVPTLPLIVPLLLAGVGWKDLR